MVHGPELVASSPTGCVDELKDAHVRLTESYIKVHKQASKERLARPIVDDHLRRRTQALHDAYLHAARTLFKHDSDQAWLIKEAATLQELESTFRWRWKLKGVATGASTVFGIPGLFGLVTATGGSAVLLSLLNACLCRLIFAAPVFASVTIYLTFSDAFFDKRKLFLRAETGVDDGIYGAEDDVFSALGLEKEPERPVDVHGWLLTAVIWALAILVENAATSRHLFYNSRAWLFWVFLLGALIMTVASFIRARRRKPA